MVHTWGGQALSLVVFVILARLLVPEDFGLVALAMVFVSLAQLVVDQGLGDALIQRREITREHIDTAFWVAVATGVLLTVVTVLLAGPIAAAVGEPELAPILQVLSITFVLSAFSSIPIALLSRELAFRSLAIRAVASIVGGGVVGIGMAFLGFGAWSLVGQQVAAAVLSVITLWPVTPWRPGLRASRDEFNDLFPFGLRVLGSDILGFVSRNADNFLIGVFLGAVPLGIYAVGHRILDVSQRLLINVARKITFPAFSRLQHDEVRLARAYLRVTRTGSVLILPGYVGLALVAPELTVLLFGATWTDAGPVAAIMFLSGPVLGAQAFSGSLLYAAGHPEVVLRFRVIATAANVAGFVAAVPFGILAVAAAFTIRAYLFLPLLLVWTRRHAAVPIGEYLAQVRGTAVATVAMAAVMAAVKLLVADRIGLATLLVIEVATGTVAFFAVLWLVDRAVLREAWAVVGQALPGVARVGRRLVRSRRGDLPTSPGGQP
jgi:PST family polysaccharide transporter